MEGTSSGTGESRKEALGMGEDERDHFAYEEEGFRPDWAACKVGKMEEGKGSSMGTWEVGMEDLVLTFLLF